jgi:ketopantoate reductase
MRAVLVGAGSVGQVYGHHLQRGGARITYVVRPHHIPRLSGGMVLYPWNRPDRTRPVHWRDYTLATSVDEALEEPADVVVLCTSTPALLDGGWFDRVAARRGRATILALNVGEDVPGFLRARVPGEAITWGLVSFAAWPAPLPGQDLPRPGMAWWVPWGERLSFSGPDAARIVAVLQAGGLPSQVVSDVLTEVAFRGIVLSMVTASLAIEGWSFRALARDRGQRILAIEAMRAWWRLAERRTGQPVPASLRALTPGVLAAILRWFLPRAPLDFEAFFRRHYTKIAHQVTALLDQRIAHLRGAGLPAAPLETMAWRLRHTRATTRLSAGDSTLVPLSPRMGAPERAGLLSLGLDPAAGDALARESAHRLAEGDLGLYAVHHAGAVVGVAGALPDEDGAPVLRLAVPGGLRLPVAKALADARRARGHAVIHARSAHDLSPVGFEPDGPERWRQPPPGVSHMPPPPAGRA